MLAIAVWFAWILHGPVVAAVSPPAGPAESAAPQPKGPFMELCRGSAACRQVAMLRSGGALVLRVTFFDPQLFVDEGDDHCDAREYWYVTARDRRLVVRDCAEQWGADTQGPVDLSFDGEMATLEYIEWESSDGCQRTVATFDPKAGQITAVRQWTGQSKDRRRQCVHQKRIKPAVRLGTGAANDPLITFHPQ